jgi:hypothetical protein
VKHIDLVSLIRTDLQSTGTSLYREAQRASFIELPVKHSREILK